MERVQPLHQRDFHVLNLLCWSAVLLLRWGWRSCSHLQQPEPAQNSAFLSSHRGAALCSALDSMPACRLWMEGEQRGGGEAQPLHLHQWTSWCSATGWALDTTPVPYMGWQWQECREEQAAYLYLTNCWPQWHIPEIQCYFYALPHQHLSHCFWWSTNRSFSGASWRTFITCCQNAPQWLAMKNMNCEDEHHNFTKSFTMLSTRNVFKMQHWEML